MAEKEGSSKISAKRKIEEVEDDASDGKQKSIKRFFGAPKEEIDLKSTEISKVPWNKQFTIYLEEIQHSEKIASFDFDGTLAKTSLFKHGPDAWSILYPTCVEKLTNLHRDGYKLVIITNQAAIGKAKASKQKVIDEKKGRLIGFIKKVNLAIPDTCGHIKGCLS
ncbi:hypothetical protein OS493_015988 [Desmophyllum pertusum]|uniref:Uncharacterized protein n=1 Tax=Desmophyllum pertusum TaxID=174260 RepID=A0A9X0CEM4_9CNID|nr:hypothetical protein OS493_015988 [Desmophyllum pertusum]